MLNRENFLKLIEENIKLHDFHCTIVSGGDVPRFVYTIGCSEKIGVEFLFAGGEYYSAADVGVIIKGIFSNIHNAVNLAGVNTVVEGLGVFKVVQMHSSWAKLLTLGVFDYYQNESIAIWQIMPDEEHRTLEVPDTTLEFDAQSNKIWQWLVRDWNYTVPSKSTAITDLSVLFGEPATEVMRWEEDAWEIFSSSGPDIPKEDMRVVPLATLIGIDSSLESAVYLGVEKGYWREDAESEWNEWG